MRTLKELRPNQRARVVKIHGSGALKRRIMDMGVTKGTEFLVRKTAPFGDPVEINIRGYELTLRKEEGSIIEVEVIDEKGQGNGHD